MTISTFDDFCDDLRDSNLLFLRYCDSAWFSEKRPTATFLAELKRGAAKDLYVNNVEARIAVADATLRHIEAHPGINDGPSFFVTLTPRKLSCPMNSAGDIEFWKIQEWVRHWLPGFNFVGMIEAAYYSNFPLNGGATQKVISWHVHLRVWGMSRSRLKRHLKAIKDSSESLLPETRAAHSRKIKAGEEAKPVLYMLKAPNVEYRVYEMKTENIDPETGEISKVGTGKWRQKKCRMRPGDRAAMCELMCGRRLDQMMFGGGEGEALVEAVFDNVRARFLNAPRNFSPTLNAF